MPVSLLGICVDGPCLLVHRSVWLPGPPPGPGSPECREVIACEKCLLGHQHKCSEGSSALQPFPPIPRPLRRHRRLGCFLGSQLHHLGSGPLWLCPFILVVTMLGVARGAVLSPSDSRAGTGLPVLGVKHDGGMGRRWWRPRSRASGGKYFIVIKWAKTPCAMTWPPLFELCHLPKWQLETETLH